jgi:hypothetical protein
MKINFSQPLKSMDGTPFTERDGEKDVILTLGTIAVSALLHNHAGDDRADGSEKFQRFELASKLYQKGEVEVSDEETSRIKNLIGKMYATRIVGPAFMALTPSTPTPTEIPAATEAPKAPSRRKGKLAAVPGNSSN